MKKIAYIELDTHAEIARNFMELTEDSTNFEVDFYFSEKVYRQIWKSHNRLKISSSEEILADLEGKLYDAVIIGTVHRHFDVYGKICENFPASIIVHNVNFLSASKLKLLAGIFEKDTVYRAKLLLKEGLLSAPKLFSKTKNLLVLDDGIRRDGLRFLPVFYNQFQSGKAAVEMKIVVPGAVSNQRRDYGHIFRWIMKFKNPFEVIFLGKASGTELHELQDLQKKIPQNIKIQFYTEKVSPEEFEQQICGADVLWCPVREEILFFGVKEIYGKTKMSGNFGDAIKYGKPAVLPTNYESKYPFIINEEKDVEAQFLKISEGFSYDFKAEFSKEKVRKKLEEALSGLKI